MCRVEGNVLRIVYKDNKSKSKGAKANEGKGNHKKGI